MKIATESRRRNSGGSKTGSHAESEAEVAAEAAPEAAADAAAGAASDAAAGAVRCRICGSRQIVTKFAFRDFDVLNCRECTTSFLDILPAGKELACLYSSDYYKTRFEYYFNNIITNPAEGRVNGNIKAFEDALRKLKEARPDRGTLLDVGCGLGIFL